MCEVCLSLPCHPRCPNAPEPPAVFICSGCGDPIYDGDDYWDILNEQWCKECVDQAQGVAEYDPY